MASNGDVHGLSGRETGPNSRLLQLHIIGARRLAKKDIFGLSDPYCTATLCNNQNEEDTICVVSTPIRKKTLNPEWNSTFTFMVDKEKHALLFELYDENRLTRDDFLGKVLVPLTGVVEDTDPASDDVKQFPLKKRSSRSHVRGILMMKLAFKAEAAQQEEDEPAVVNEPGWETVSVEDVPDEPALQRHLSSSPHSMLPTVSEDDPIPNGWERREDANGRMYFVDHVTRTTTWRRPTVETQTARQLSRSDIEQRLARNFSVRRHISVEDSFVSGDNASTDPPAAEQAEALLPGWEERQDDSGRVFFVDHANRATSWIRPTAGSSPATPSTSTRDQSSDAAAAGADSPPFSSLPERLHVNVPSASEIPLPAGWAMQLAPNGRVFFIDHNTRETSWTDPRISVTEVNPDLGPLLPGWEERVHTDGRIFFIDHNTQSTQWEDPRMQKLSTKAKSQAVPYSRDYKRKYDFFKSRLRKPDNVPTKCELHMRRASILEDSYRSVMVACTNPEALKAKLWIVFDGETGLDYGGVAREWFYLLSKEVFNPYYGLFEYSATDNYTLQINPNSGLCNDDHLSYFKFIGRVAGMAVYHGKLLDAFFIRPFYKMMLGKKMTLQDMESVDSEYYNSLKWLQENDPEVLDLRFQVEEEVFGTVTSKELKKGGKDIPVLEKNKQEYIELVIKWRFVDRISSQMKNFVEGFNDLIPSNVVRVFDERELEYLLCGLGEIEVGDWKRHTNYRGGYSDKHVVVQWFWKAVETFDSEMKARLLQFVTGTSRVPMNGFAELYGSNGPQRFTIERWGNTHSLPRAHTCFNRIDLPPYTSYHELREKLRLAIENTEGFEGVD